MHCIKQKNIHRYFFIGFLDSLHLDNPNALYHIFLQYLYNILVSEFYILRNLYKSYMDFLQKCQIALDNKDPKLLLNSIFHIPL